MISECSKDTGRAAETALKYLGPELAVTEVIDNAKASLAYGEEPTENCWRIYFEPCLHEQTQVGGDSSYILIEKETYRIIGRGIERSE